MPEKTHGLKVPRVHDLGEIKQEDVIGCEDVNIDRGKNGCEEDLKALQLAI